MNVTDIDTPAVVIDLDRVEANLARAQAYADANGLRLRPHVKTHKFSSLARKQMKLRDVHEIITFCGPTKLRRYPWREANNLFLILRFWVLNYFLVGHNLP